MVIDSIDVVLYTAYFVLPGYIIFNIIEDFIPSGEKSDAEKLVSFIGYSLIEIAGWYWLIDKLPRTDKWYWLILLLIVVITSAITGFIIGLLLKIGPIRKLLSKTGLQIQNRIPTAWDYKFSNLNEGRKVIVALNDGTYIRGLYYNKSFASSDSSYRDIYIEKCCILNKKEKWREVDQNDGVWINPNTIKWINFMEDK